MKKPIITLFLIMASLAAQTVMADQDKDTTAPLEKSLQQDSVLRHVVLFKFKEGTTPKKVREIERAFSALQKKIPQIHSYEWGLNNSPENINKGFTHCFFLTFLSEEDRAIYLPHPDHKAFGDLLGPYLEDVLVIDYWN